MDEPVMSAERQQEGLDLRQIEARAIVAAIVFRTLEIKECPSFADLDRWTAEIERLRRLPAEAGWQDIESAPKDGTWMLGHWSELPAELRVGTVRFRNDRWRDEFGICDDPTHWMPLPSAPPAATRESEE